jgi:REP element-mobilizing transposase RayT
MTLPREIHPGRTYLITRRCTQRQFLLRPDDKTNAIFEYCLAEAAERHRIELVAWLAMSNHYHAVVHDPDGRLPAFLEHFHKMVAKALNVRWSRWENLWATEETCVTYLPTPADVFDKVVYCLTNPVNDHLVERATDWPGSSSLRHLEGERTAPARPRIFFRETGRMPESAELRAAPPPRWSGGKSSESAAAWAERVRDAIAKKERAAREERVRAGRRVLGRRAVRMASASDSPSSTEPRRNLRPAVACKNVARRIGEIAKLVEFRKKYSAARLRYVAGERTVEFPAGTYRLRAWGVRCAPFPACA